MASISLAASDVRGQGRVGAFVDRIQWIDEYNQPRALQEILDGTLDLYMFPLRNAADIEAARMNPEMWTIDADGTHFDLLINPVPVDQTLAPGKFNPFAISEVREAMNYLIDREFIARELGGGGLIPQTAIWGSRSPEYARDAAFFSHLERQYAYDPTRGRQMVFSALAEVPEVTFDGGQWKFRGTPIILTFLIRIEDVRRDVGNYVADQVEGLGFVVNRTYGCMLGCFCPPQYCDPPETGAWNVATEAWANTMITAWADADPLFYHAGGDGGAIWTRYQPGWELSDVAGRLADGRYADLPERQALIERAARLALSDSVRVWIGSGATFAVSTRVRGLVFDLTGGAWSPLAARTARFATAGGTLHVGQRLHFIAPWNPWRGFGWIYDALESYAITDAAAWPNPHTGLSMTIRANPTVFTAGPTGTMDVPTDAQVWDNATMGFNGVAPGTTAISAVNWTLTFGAWHDGEPFDMNDVLYELALVYRRANSAGDVHAKDADAAGEASSRLSTLLKAFKVTGPNTISFYIDSWHPDAGVIASVANPAFPTTPWTASELALATVFDDTCRLSESTAGFESKDPLDLTKGQCLAAMDGYVPSYRAGGHEPPGLAASFPDPETSARWAALGTFRNLYGHYFASNGPFVLSRVDAAAAQTEMTRDPNYPFDASRFDGLLAPRVPQISLVAPPQVVPGLRANFTMAATLANQPYDEVTIDYWIESSSGEMMFPGEASRVAPGVFRASLEETQTGSMEPGTYWLLTVAVGVDAAVPVFSSLSFEVIPLIQYVGDLLNPPCLLAAGCRPFNPVRDRLEAEAASLSALKAELLSLQGIVGAAIALSTAATVASLISAIFVLRRLRGEARRRTVRVG